MPLIRSVFQDELDSVSQTLFELSVMVSDSMAKATRALIGKNLPLAEEVITFDEKIDTVQHDLDARIIDIIARQQPVASDLRALVTALRMSADLERMGDLAHHVAKVVRLRHPASAVPEQLLQLIESMGEAAEKIAAKTGVVISKRDTALAAQVEKDDD
jgi:phosphate transport system protein